MFACLLTSYWQFPFSMFLGCVAVNVFTILCDTFNSKLYLTSVLINYSVLELTNAIIPDNNRWSRITSGPAATSY